MYILIIKFNLRGISDQDFRVRCDRQLAEAFARIPGLISKIWLANSDTNTYGGVCVWQDRQAMEDYIRSGTFRALVTNPQYANLTLDDFGVLEGPTKITNGLLEGRI